MTTQSKMKFILPKMSTTSHNEIEIDGIFSLQIIYMNGYVTLQNQ